MAFTIAATQAAATDGIWPGRGAPSVLGETSAPITVPSGRTRGVIKGGCGTQVCGEKIVYISSGYAYPSALLWVDLLIKKKSVLVKKKIVTEAKIKKTTIINKI